MYFLVEYERATGRLARLRSFTAHETAQDERLATEIKYLRSGGNMEIVLLDAVDETALRATHQRYFVPLKELARFRASDTDR